jgi:hypothetical protein
MNFKVKKKKHIIWAFLIKWNHLTQISIFVVA